MGIQSSDEELSEEMNGCIEKIKENFLMLEQLLLQDISFRTCLFGSTTEIILNDFFKSITHFSTGIEKKFPAESEPRLKELMFNKLNLLKEKAREIIEISAIASNTSETPDAEPVLSSSASSISSSSLSSLSVFAATNAATLSSLSSLSSSAHSIPPSVPASTTPHFWSLSSHRQHDTEAATNTLSSYVQKY